MNESAFADTPASRCAFYRRTCGLPAGVHPQIGRITVRAGMIGAITMPVHLGLRIRACMLRRNLPLGPIIAHPRSQRWTFLVRPDISDADVKLYAEMFRSYVTVVRAGGEIALPSPADTKAGFRDWIVPPRDSFRPSGAAIIDLVRECTRATLR